MNKNIVIAMLVLGGIVMLVNSASAVTAKPRPTPIVPPTSPNPQPIVSGN